MQKNLVLALVLTSIIWIVWYTWVVPPPQNITQKKIEITSENKSNNISQQKTEIKEISQNKLIEENNIAYELKNQKARFYLTQSLALKEIYYTGPVQEINLIPQNFSFLKIFDNFKYTKLHQTNNTITITAKTSDIEITKTLKISENNGINNLQIRIKNLSKKTIQINPTEINIGPGLNTVKSEEGENHKIWQAIYSYKKEKRKNPVIEKIKSDHNNLDFLWAAIENRYFIFAILNDNKQFSSIKFIQEKVSEHNAPKINLVTDEIMIKPGELYNFDVKFYVGPKDYEFLKKLGWGLHLSIDFGFFAPLAKIANTLLKKFYNLTNNYGIAIVLLSILVQIVMLPLTFKSYKAMAIMKKMQPEMKSIQERYKKDPQRMNLELMNLYKRYGANPFSGCWPMLLQIPIFFALFTTLRNSWDLHGASFILWIKDLSDKDPYYILPILMGALMFAQNYISPQSVQDPTQATVMKWMPIIFTFLFLTFPSGLVIYWIINSIFSIMLSYYMKQRGLYS
ncbi:MAG: membrane protein insertase YidC [Elusimicrobiales bacterium]|nr:membrane protein insertase YidC [Elusimicrobiales bacterium]